MNDLHERRSTLLNGYMNNELDDDEFHKQMQDLDAELELTGTGSCFTPEEMVKRTRQKYREHTTKKNRTANLKSELEYWERVIAYKEQRS